MTYYRLAVQDQQSTQWTWKTTPVTSLQAVLHLLRSYRMLPQDGIRVFTASSEAELREMLSRQNDHLESGSITAIQFLQARRISVGEQAQNTAEERVSPQTVQQATGNGARAAQQGARGTSTSSQLGTPAPTGFSASLGMSLLERKRLEIELGPGGDHDTPYLFTLPVSQQERLAWIRLQKQAQAGEEVLQC